MTYRYPLFLTAVAVVCLAAVAVPATAQPIVNPGTLVAFNPQPDPPGFGIVPVRANQIIWLNVVCFPHPIGNSPPDPPGFGMVTLVGQGVRLATSCFEHPVNGVPPGPCRGTVMIHDAAGNVLRSAQYDLKPGETGFLDYAPLRNTDARSLVSI